jgi:elongation factor P--(R)-beta-lysine ligase
VRLPYCCGIELANAFAELTDPKEQRPRFLAGRARRAALGRQDWPMDMDLLTALTQMPHCAGIALGVDWLAMPPGAARIAQVQWLPEEET